MISKTAKELLKLRYKGTLGIKAKKHAEEDETSITLASPPENPEIDISHIYLEGFSPSLAKAVYLRGHAKKIISNSAQNEIISLCYVDLVLNFGVYPLKIEEEGEKVQVFYEARFLP